MAPETKKSSLLRWTLPLLLLGLVAATATAQQIELKIVDESEKGIAEATISIQQVGGDHSQSGTTNKKGVYKESFGGAPGNYTVRVEKEGFGVWQDDIEIGEGGVEGSVTLIDAAKAAKGQAVDAFNAGVGLLQGGKSAEALAKFQEATQLDPTLPDSYRLIAAIEAMDGDAAVAVEALEQYRQLMPDDSSIAPIAYEAYRRTGDTEAAAAARDLIAGQPAGTEAAVRVFNDGVAKTKTDELDAAKALFEEALVLDPTLAPASRSLAALHFNEQDWAGALPYVERALETTPDSADVLRMQFFSLVNLDRANEATPVFAKWFAAKPSASEEALEQANVFFEANDFETAEEIAGAVVAAQPDNGQGHYTMGKIYAALSRPDEAKAELQKFLELSPNDPEAAAARAMLEGL